jgi:hypothetical protein
MKKAGNSFRLQTACTYGAAFGITLDSHPLSLPVMTKKGRMDLIRRGLLCFDGRWFYFNRTVM